MIFKANSFSNVECWSEPMPMCWSMSRPSSTYGSLDNFWSESWSGYRVFSYWWSTEDTCWGSTDT